MHSCMISHFTDLSTDTVLEFKETIGISPGNQQSENIKRSVELAGLSVAIRLIDTTLLLTWL